MPLSNVSGVQVLAGSLTTQLAAIVTKYTDGSTVTDARAAVTAFAQMQDEWKTLENTLNATVDLLDSD